MDLAGKIASLLGEYTAQGENLLDYLLDYAKTGRKAD